MQKILLILIMVMFIGIEWACAHGDVNESTRRVSREISSHPNDPALFVERGRYRSEARYYDLAISDYEHAIDIDPEYSEAYYYLSQARLAMKDLAHALENVDQFIAKTNSKAAKSNGYTLKGDILSADSKYLLAADAYQESLALSEVSVPPVIYVKLAEAYRKAGPQQIPKAIATLNNGIEKLGPLVVLNQAALELEIESQQFENALLRLNTMIEQSPKQPFLWQEKAAALEKLHRNEEAKASYQHVLQLINELPLPRQKTPAMNELTNQINAALSRLP